MSYVNKTFMQISKCFEVARAETEFTLHADSESESDGLYLPFWDYPSPFISLVDSFVACRSRLQPVSINNVTFEFYKSTYIYLHLKIEHTVP